MTARQFNEKYQDFIEEGFWGLEFDIPPVTEYLDNLMPSLIVRKGFKFSQIKLKFGRARFYAKSVLSSEAGEIENGINDIVSKYDEDR